jgi:hypothetical protein
LNTVNAIPLIVEDSRIRVNVLAFDKKYKKNLTIALLSLEKDDTRWITYEEFSFVKSSIDDAIREEDLKVEIYRNNLYPECYPIPFDINRELYEEICRSFEDNLSDQSEDCSHYLSVYSSISNINGRLYGSFYNFEYEHEKNTEVNQYYPINLEVEETNEESDYVLYLNDDIDTFLRDYEDIKQKRIRILGLQYTNGNISALLKQTILAYCIQSDIRVVRFNEKFEEAMINEPMKESRLINIPHTVKETPFSYFDENIYQMVSAYQKIISAPAQWDGKVVILTFEAVGHACDLYINGKHVKHHDCGYTAFSADVSKDSPCLPSIIALAMQSAIKLTARIASSFPGIA